MERAVKRITNRHHVRAPLNAAMIFATLTVRVHRLIASTLPEPFRLGLEKPRPGWAGRRLSRDTSLIRPNTIRGISYTTDGAAIRPGTDCPCVPNHVKRMGRSLDSRRREGCRDRTPLRRVRSELPDMR